MISMRGDCPLGSTKGAVAVEAATLLKGKQCPCFSARVTVASLLEPLLPYESTLIALLAYQLPAHFSLGASRMLSRDSQPDARPALSISAGGVILQTDHFRRAPAASAVFE